MVWTNDGWTTWWKIVTIAVALGGCKGTPPAHSAPTDEAPATDKASATDEAAAHRAATGADRPGSFADLVAKVRPAVVNIYTRQEVVARPRFQPFSNRKMVPRRRIQESLGSGFIIDQKGYVLTNYHVVKHATEIGIRLFDERFFKAKIVGADPKTDVALLRINNNAEHTDSLPAIAMGNSQKLRVGDWVVAIGNPLGLTSTVTAGITSAIGRRGIPISKEMRYQDFIQTDASINPGNSGGPLINSSGKVVGINTAISAEGQGIGFAIPINMAADIVPQLKKNGHVERSWLGIYVDDVNHRVREKLGLDTDHSGARVTHVVPGGPAEDAQLQSGDIILSIDDTPIDDAGHLTWLASNLGIGRTVTVEFQRNGAHHTTDLTMGALPN